MKLGDLIRKKHSHAFVDGKWCDVIAFYCGTIPKGTKHDDHGFVYTTYLIDIYVVYLGKKDTSRYFAISDEWEVYQESN